MSTPRCPSVSSRSPRGTLRPLRACTLAVLALVAHNSLIGCARPKPPPAVAEGRFGTLPVSLDSSRGTHQVLVETPTPGWRVTLDQARPSWQRTDVFLTARRPSPLFVYPQVVTTSQVGTPVPTSDPVAVFVRILESDQPDDAPDPYAQAHP